jgi:hypothetical protein
MRRPSVSKQYFKDLGERCAWTFVQAFLATYAVTGGRKAAESAAVAGVAAVLAVIKGVAAKKVGDPNSASTVPSI